MKFIITVLFICLACSVYAQKTSIYTYKIVDTLNQYKDAETIIYRNATGKFIIDTVYFNKMTHDIDIEYVVVLNKYPNRKFKH